MAHIVIEQVAQFVGSQLQDENLANQVVTRLVRDNRDAGEGTLFAAIKGARVDGHNFVADALAKGAPAALVTDEETAIASGAPREKLIVVPNIYTAMADLAHHWLQQIRQRKFNTGVSKPTVVAVTGSVGKTTTKDLLAQLFSLKGEVVAADKSYNNEVGLPITVLNANADTVSLILEMGAAGPGDIANLCQVAPPDIAIVLKVAKAHLGGFGAEENIVSAKAELVQGALSHAPIIINIDDDNVYGMRTLAKGPVYGFSSTGRKCAEVEAQIWATQVTVDAFDRPKFRVWAKGFVYDTQYYEEKLSQYPQLQIEIGNDDGQPVISALVTLPLSGVHNVNNALAALLAGLVAKIDFCALVSKINNCLALSAHRMCVHTLINGNVIVDDAYNANPSSMRAALDAIDRMSHRSKESEQTHLAEQMQIKQRVAVIGDMAELGEASALEHESLGNYLLDKVDQVLFVGKQMQAAYAVAKAHIIAANYYPEVEQVSLAVQEIIAKSENTIFLLKGSNASGVWKIAEQINISVNTENLVELDKHDVSVMPENKYAGE